jgi:uncharacterized protein YcbK (DUF882 family)
MKRFLSSIGIKCIIYIVASCFFLDSLNPPPVQALEFFLPKPGTMVFLSRGINPPVLKGIKINAGNPFRFDFIIDMGDSQAQDKQVVKDESIKLIKFFLASLTIPEKDLWVNLSPYEKGRIISKNFGDTVMGEQLLAQDYLLKQITASIIYPEGEVGKEFWHKVYAAVFRQFGSYDVPVNTFNKVWIMPDKAKVYENAANNSAMVVQSSLKVMLEEDFLAFSKEKKDDATKLSSSEDIAHSIASKIVREIIIPQLTKEVNEGKNFAVLRQVYNSLILAIWYKNKLKHSLLSKGFVDRNKTVGVDIQDKETKEEIYQQYIKSFKKGVYNYIKEEPDPITNEMVPRKYFSGGVTMEDIGFRVNAQVVSGPNEAREAARVLENATNLRQVSAGLEAGIGVVVTPQGSTASQDRQVNPNIETLAAKEFEKASGKLLHPGDFKSLLHLGLVTIPNEHGRVLGNPESNKAPPKWFRINLTSLVSRRSVKSNVQTTQVRASSPQTDFAMAVADSVAEATTLAEDQQELTQAERFAQESSNERVKGFNELLASIVNGKADISQPEVLSSVADRILAFHQAAEGNLVAQRIDAYQQLLERSNRIQTAVAPQIRAMEKELNEFRSNLTQDQLNRIEKLLYVMQQEYLALEPLEAINGLDILPLKIRSGYNLDQNSAIEIAGRIAKSREALENISESLSWESDTLLSHGPVSVQILDQISTENPNIVIRFDAHSGKIQIGRDALSLTEEEFALRLHKEFRNALVHTAARDLGKVLKTNRDSQDLLEEKMSNLAGKGEAFSELILYANMVEGLDFNKISDFLDILLSQGELGYDKLEQYVTLKSHRPGRLRGIETQDAKEEKDMPGGFRQAVASFIGFIRRNPAVAAVPMVLIAMMSVAAGTAHASAFDHPGAGGAPGGLDQVGMNTHQPLPQPLVFDHLVLRGSHGSDVTSVGPQLMGHVGAADLQHLAGQVNPITGRPYDGPFLSGSSHKIVQRAENAVKGGVFNMDVERVVVAFQHAHHLREDGVIGPEVIGTLNALDGTNTQGSALPPTTPNAGSLSGSTGAGSHITPVAADFNHHVNTGVPAFNHQVINSSAGAANVLTPSDATAHFQRASYSQAAGGQGGGPKGGPPRGRRSSFVTVAQNSGTPSVPNNQQATPANGQDWHSLAIANIKHHESFVPTVYPDPVTGRDLIGYGFDFEYFHNLFSPGVAARQQVMSRAEADRILEMLVKKSFDDVIQLYGSGTFSKIPEPVKALLVELDYQMGPDALSNFNHFGAAIKSGDYNRAAESLRASLLARQTPSRASDYLAVLTNTGVDLTAQAAEAQLKQTIEDRVKVINAQYAAQGRTNIGNIISSVEGPEDAVFGIMRGGYYFKVTALQGAKPVDAEEVPAAVQAALQVNVEHPLVWMVNKSRVQEAVEAMNNGQPLKAQAYQEDYRKLLNNTGLALFDKLEGSVIDTLYDTSIPTTEFSAADGKFAPAKFALVMANNSIAQKLVEAGLAGSAPATETAFNENSQEYKDVLAQLAQKSIQPITKNDFNQDQAPLDINNIHVEPLLIAKLNQMQALLGKQLTLSSGFRTEEYNQLLRQEGYAAAANSNHMYGRAADIPLSDHRAGKDRPDLTLAELATAARSVGLSVEAVNLTPDHLHVQLSSGASTSTVFAPAYSPEEIINASNKIKTVALQPVGAATTPSRETFDKYNGQLNQVSQGGQAEPVNGEQARIAVKIGENYKAVQTSLNIDQNYPHIAVIVSNTYGENMFQPIPGMVFDQLYGARKGSLSRFVNDAHLNVSVENYAVPPATEGNVNLANIENWGTRIYSGLDVVEAQKQHKSVVTFVRWTDDNGVNHKGLLMTGTKMAAMQEEMARNGYAGKILEQIGLQVTDTPTASGQQELLTQFSNGLHAEYRDRLPLTGALNAEHVAGGFEVSRDQWGNSQTIKRFLYREDIKEEVINIGPEQRPLPVLRLSDGRILKYWPYNEDQSLVIYSTLTDAETARLMAGQEDVLTSYPSAENGLPTNPMERGEIILGNNTNMAKWLDARVSEFVAEKEKTAAIQYRKYLEHKLKLNKILFPINVGLQFTSFGGAGMISPALNFLWDLKAHPTQWQQKPPTPAEVNQLFAQFQMAQEKNLNGVPENQIDSSWKGLSEKERADYLARANSFVTGVHSPQEMEAMYNYLNTRKTQATAAYYLGLASQLAQLFSTTPHALPTKKAGAFGPVPLSGFKEITSLNPKANNPAAVNSPFNPNNPNGYWQPVPGMPGYVELKPGVSLTTSIVANGQTVFVLSPSVQKELFADFSSGNPAKPGLDYVTMYSLLNTSLSKFVQWDVAKYEALNAVISQRYVSFTGDINVESILYRVITGKDSHFVSLKNMAGADSFANKFISLFGVTVDLKSIVNQLHMSTSGNPMTVPFKNAPHHIRLSLYPLGLPLNLFWDTADARTLEKIVTGIDVKTGQPKNYVGYMVHDGTFRSTPTGYTQEQAEALYHSPKMARVPMVMDVSLGGKPTQVPVYLVEDGNGKMSMFILTQKGAEIYRKQIEKDVHRGEEYVKAIEQGGSAIQVGSEGGTTNQNIWSKLFVSHDNQADVYFPSAYGWTQYNMVIRSLHSGNPEIAAGILDYYNNAYNVLTSNHMAFGGFQASANAYTGEAFGRRDTVTTAAIANAVIAYERATRDHKYDGMLNGLANWLMKAHEKNGHGGIANDPTGKLRYAEPNAIVAAFFENYGEYNHNPKFTQAANDITAWVQANLWDSQNGMMKNGENDNGYSADAQTRWLKYLGPERFTATFLNNDPQALMDYLQRIQTTFKGERGLLDIADSLHQQKRLETGEELHNGMPEVTAEFVGNLTEAQKYFTRVGRPELAGSAEELARNYRTSIQSVQDANGNLPQAIYGDEDTGFGYRTAVGNRALDSNIERDLSFAGINSLRPWTAPGAALPHLKLPSTMLSRDMLSNGTIVEPGDASYEYYRVLISNLIERENLQKQQTPLTADARTRLDGLNKMTQRLVYGNPNGLEAVYVRADGLPVHVTLLPSMKRTEEYQAQMQNNKVNADKIASAYQGAAGSEEGGFALGAPVIKKGQVNDGGRIGDIHASSDLDHGFDRILNAINDLPVEQKAAIQYKHFNNFLLNFDVNNDGHKTPVIVSLFFPLDKPLVRDVPPGPSSVMPSYSIFEKGLELFKIDDQTVTVITYDKPTQMKTDIKAFANFEGSREAMLKRLMALPSTEARLAEFEGRTPTAEAKTVKSVYIDPNTFTPDQIAADKVLYTMRAADYNTGKITTQFFSVYDRPVMEADQFKVTVNHFNKYGRLTYSETFKNTGTLQEPSKGLKIFEDREFIVKDGQTHSVTDNDRTLPEKSFINHYDVGLDISSVQVYDNHNFGLKVAEYMKDSFRNPNGYVYHSNMELVPQYKPDFFGGRIPYRTLIINSDNGKLHKISETMSYDTKTEITKVNEVDQRGGGTVTKTIEPIYGQTLTESRTDSVLKRRIVITNNYSDRLNVVSTTTVYSDDNRNMSGESIKTVGQYNRDLHEWTLEQTRWNYRQNTQFVNNTATSHLSARGTLNYEDTVYNPKNQFEINGQTYPDLARRFMPEYDNDWNISRISEGDLLNGKFTPKKVTNFSDYTDGHGNDFFAARSSQTTKIIDGKEFPFSKAELLTSPEEFRKTGKLNFEVSSLIFDNDKWIETNTREGVLVEKTIQAFDSDNKVVGQEVTHFDKFDVQNIPTVSTATVLQPGQAAFNSSTSSDATSLEEARLGLIRSQVKNHITGLDTQELKDRWGRVIENDMGTINPASQKFELQRKMVLHDFNDFDIARHSYTNSILNGQLTPYTKSELETPSSALSEYDYIRDTRGIQFYVRNVFLSSKSHDVVWREVKDYRGRVAETYKGNVLNGQFEVTRHTHSNFNGIPGLIGVADGTTTTMVINGQEGMITDRSHLMTAHGDIITAPNDNLPNSKNFNEVSAKDIYNSVHRIRYQGESFFKVVTQATSDMRDYQEVRNNLGNVEITLYGSKDTQRVFVPERREYRIYETEGLNKYGNFDIATSTFATLGPTGQEEVVSYSNNTHITTEDRFLIYKTQKGIGAPGLTLTGDIYVNHSAMEKLLAANNHKMRLVHPIATVMQVKDDEGREKITFSGFTAIDPITGFGTGAPNFVTINTYDENKVSQPFAFPESKTYVWEKGMKEARNTDGDVTPVNNASHISDFINSGSATLIATLDSLTFGGGKAEYHAWDRREIGLRALALRLDGTLKENYFEGIGQDRNIDNTGLQGPKKFKLYYDKYELPAYGANLESGHEEPYSWYSSTLFDFNGKPYVLNDEFLGPRKENPDAKPHASTLSSNGIVERVEGKYVVRTTPFSSVVNPGDMERNSIVGKAVHGALTLAGESERTDVTTQNVVSNGNFFTRLIAKIFPGSESEKALKNGHQRAGDQNVRKYVDSLSEGKDFKDVTWWQQAVHAVAHLGILAGVMVASLMAMFLLKATGLMSFGKKARYLDVNNDQQQDFEDMGFTVEQSQIIMNDRFNKGAFVDFQDFQTRIGDKLKYAHKLSERWFRRILAEKRFNMAMDRLSGLNFGPKANNFNQENYDRLAASGGNVKDFMEGLSEIYNLKPEQEASYNSALKMFDKYLTSEQLRAIIATEHFKSLIGHYNKQRAVEVIMRLMYEAIRDNQDYKNAIKDRVDSIIRSTGLDKEFPDQIFALRDTFLRNIENARLLPEGLKFHDFDIGTDLLAYSWDDLRKGPDMQRQVSSNLVSVEKLFVFQTIFQRALFSLAGQGRAEEYLWAKYVYPFIHDSDALKNADILAKIKAFRQVFHAVMIDEVSKRLEANRDPKGKIKYFQYIINEEVYNDAFRYLIGQKEPTMSDANWVLPDKVSKDVAPLRSNFEAILDKINTVIDSPAEQRGKAVQAIADELKPVMLAFVSAVDEKIGMPVVKGRLTYWKLTVIPLLKMVTDGKMRRRIFSNGGPYNQTAKDMVRRLNNYAVIGVTTGLFIFLTINMLGLLPLMALPQSIVLSWNLTAGIGALFTSLLGGFGIKWALLKSLNKGLKSNDNEKKTGAIKKFNSRLKFLYSGQAAFVLGAFLLAPFLAPLLGLTAPLIWIPLVAIKVAHIIPILIFIETWRLSFYAVNYLLMSLAEKNYYVANNVYELNTKDTKKIIGRLMALFTDAAPANGTLYKTRGQERLASFVNNVDEMTSDEDGYFYGDNIAADETSKLTDVLTNLAGSLADSNGDIQADKVAELKTQIEWFVSQLEKPLTITGEEGQEYKSKSNKIAAFLTGEERQGLQKVIDYINHNYRTDKGANPSSWDQVIPMTTAIHGFSEDWYFTNGELLDVSRGNILKDQIIKIGGPVLLNQLLTKGILLQDADNTAEVLLNPERNLNDEEIREIAKQAGVFDQDIGIDIAKVRAALEDAKHIKKSEFKKLNGIGGAVFLDNLLYEGILLEDKNSPEEVFLNPEKEFNEADIKAIANQSWVFAKIWPMLVESRDSKKESQEFTHRLGMLAKYKTELFLLMVKRLTTDDSTERNELLKMIDNPAYKPEGIEKWDIWPAITEWANRQLPTGYANAITQKHTLKRLYTYHAKMFEVPNPEAAAEEKIRIMDRNLMGINELDKIFGGENGKSPKNGKLRELVDVLIETNYQSTYIAYPDGTERGIKDPYAILDAKAPANGKYDRLMLKKLLDMIIKERLFPVRLLNGGVNDNPLISENYHAAKWNQKTSILPYLIGPVILNLDADHRANYVDMEFVPNHLLEYNYLPGLATSTPIVKHTLTKGLGIFGNILPVSENAFYYHAQQGKELFGGLTAYGKLFERVSALRHSEGITDSYVAEDALTPMRYRASGYIVGRAGSVKVEKGWPFSFGAAITPVRKWSYDSVESVTGRTSMKMLISPFVDWPYLANNYWLDGFGFYFKKPNIIRYMRWLMAFYLVLDWNLFSNIPMALWFGSLMLSQAISHGLFQYKIYDESRGFIRGTISAVTHVVSEMYVNFVHIIFVFEETIKKLASNRLGRFISTASKGANQTRIENKELHYVRSSYAIKSAAVIALATLVFVGISPVKSVLWAPTLFAGIVGVAAPFLLNPVRIQFRNIFSNLKFWSSSHNKGEVKNTGKTKDTVRSFVAISRYNDIYSNVKDIFQAFWWALVDNVEKLQYGISKILPFARTPEDNVQRKVLDLVDANLPKPFEEILIETENTPPERVKIFNNAFGTVKGPSILELTEYIYLFHQNPSHYRDMYGRAVLPAVYKLLSYLAEKTENVPKDYTKKNPRGGEENYKNQLRDILKAVKEYLTALKEVRGLQNNISNVEKTQLKEAEDILNNPDSTVKQLDEANRLLNQISWMPLGIQSKKAVRSFAADTLFSIIGTDATLQAVTLYLLLPVLFLWDRVKRHKEIDDDYNNALKIPQSTNPANLPSPSNGDSAMLTEIRDHISKKTPMAPLSGKDVKSLQGMIGTALEGPSNRIARRIFNDTAMQAVNRKPSSTGGINLGSTRVQVETSGDMIQTAFDDPAMLRLLLNSDGLTPVINDIKVMTPSMKAHFLGLN